MKALILALILLVAPMGASAKQSPEQCLIVAQTVFWAAQGRDIGSEPKDIINGLVKAGVGFPRAFLIAKLVFENANVTPNEIATQLFNRCTSEAI